MLRHPISDQSMVTPLRWVGRRIPSFPMNTSCWQGSRIPSYPQPSFQTYRSSMRKAVKRHNSTVGVAVLKAVLESSSFHQWRTQVELLGRLKKVALYAHLLIQVSQTETHEVKATQFCCSTLVVFKNYTSEGTVCLSHPTPCTHTPSREHTQLPKTMARGTESTRWKGKGGSQFISAL